MYFRLRSGVNVRKEDLRFLRRKDEIVKERDLFRDCATSFIDVSDKVQQMVSKGGLTLKLDKNTFDANATFGNPCPGYIKLLEIQVTSQGHDSEHLTTNAEVLHCKRLRPYIHTHKRSLGIP